MDTMKTLNVYRVTVEFSGTSDYLIYAEDEASVRAIFERQGSFDHIANRFRDLVGEEIEHIELVKKEQPVS